MTNRRNLVNRVKKFRLSQLLIKYGFAPWQRLVAEARINEDKADEYRDDRLLSQHFMALRGYFLSVKKERVRIEHAQSHMAAAHVKRGLIRRHWRHWQLYRRMLRAKAVAVTGEFSRFSAIKRTWRIWRVALERSRRHEMMALRLHSAKGDRCVLNHCFQRWSEYMEGVHLRREVESRTEQTWQKIQSWLK